jgi:acylphosphatase
VRNTSGGAVEVVPAGTSELLEKLAKKLRKGPPASRVDSVSLVTNPAISAEELPPDFQVIR